MEYNEPLCCCFIGHRTIEKDKILKEKLLQTIEKLITSKGVETFLFGSRSEFDDLCYMVVTLLKEKYSHIKRIYVRGEYADINKSYNDFLLKSYEDTYFPPGIKNAGKAVYVERNCEMINKSTYCIVYYNANRLTSVKSGTEIAYKYAVKRGVKIINMYY